MFRFEQVTPQVVEDGRNPIVGTPERIATLAADLREVGGRLAVAALAFGRAPAAGEVRGGPGPAADGVDAAGWTAGHSAAIRTGTRVALPLAGGGVPALE